MVESSNHDTQYASQVIEQLFRGYRERPDLELEDDIVISDLEHDVDLFSSDLEIAESFDGRLPALRVVADDEYVPVSLQLVFGSIWPFYPLGTRPWGHHPVIDEYYYFMFRSMRDKDQIAGFLTISINEAREAFIKRAINFLTTRIAAVRNFREDQFRDRDGWFSPTSLNLMQFVGGKRVTTPGCSFYVSTNTSGLRVFWSGAYYIYANYFSHPTTPVNSVLQAGTYVFGVDGGAYGSKIQWDTNAVVSLPGKSSVHLNY